jgi:hypothetical protein
MINKTGKTTDVSSLTNSAMMALDKEFRKNKVPFAHRHREARVMLESLVASVLADHIAEMVIEETRDERVA